MHSIFDESLVGMEAITALSHAFGTADYVKGGGGNTSFKNETTLWVKPSGTTLAGLTPEAFVQLSRAKINALYGVETPSALPAREELVKKLMAAAVENDAGRPSVEAPLHNVFEAKYVVHTHPALVNGLTCSMDGEAVCGRLFPDALWVEYVDPGYTLCMVVRERFEAYRKAKGKEPSMLMLQNHGIFVAADEPDEIRAVYKNVMSTLKAEYTKAGVLEQLAVPEAPRCEVAEDKIRALFGDDALFISSSCIFPSARGPITPDHLVYSKAYAYRGALSESGAQAYFNERGYAPKVIVYGGRVYGIGHTQCNADLALELIQDGALVVQLADAFGGIHYMSDAHREFIENWEVESYRARQVA
ncbi:class II aldolase/adducin family protein [Pontiellaceae bacterium B1224]|nr:class II aldolase/adducin family protein [Pontiellaceae bacterium B1224]